MRQDRSTAPSARGIRLQKAMADAGIGARRDCEDMITAGRVKVNGKVVTTLPVFIDPARATVLLDEEKVQPEAVAAVAVGSDTAPVPAKRSFTYALVNKPKGVITTTS